MTSDWRNNVAPTHKCTVCGALWRYWPKRDTGWEDSWSLRSATCGPCCDNAPMGEQIVPMSVQDMVNYATACAAVDAMTQHLHGPKADDVVN